MRYFLVAMIFMLQPTIAGAASYGAYGTYGYNGNYGPYGAQQGFNVYIAPQPPVIAAPQIPSPSQELNQLSQAYMMIQQGKMLQAQRWQQMQYQRQQIMFMQMRLKQEGYDPGTIDGIWGPRSEEAAKNFLRDKGMVQSN